MTTKGATNVIIVCDEFAYSDFPVYVMPGQDPAQECQSINMRSLAKVMEVYNSLRPNRRTTCRETLLQVLR